MLNSFPGYTIIPDPEITLWEYKYRGSHIFQMSMKYFDNIKDTSEFTEGEVKKVVALAGVSTRRVVDEKTCSSDLCSAAAKSLIDSLKWGPDRAASQRAPVCQPRIRSRELPGKTYPAFAARPGLRQWMHGAWLWAYKGKRLHPKGA